MKLSYKIYILFGIASAITILSVFGTTYYLMREILVDGQYTAYGKLANISARSIDFFLHERLTETEVLATRTILSDALSNSSLERLSQIQEGLTENVAINKHIDAIYVIDLKKNVIIATDGGNLGGVPDQAVQESVLNKVFSGESAYSDVFISERTKEPTMIFAVPVLDDKKNILGAVEEYIDWSAIFEILKEADATFIHLVNSKGMEIGSNNPEDYEDVLVEDYSREAAYLKFTSGVFGDGTSASQVSIEKDLHRDSEVVMAIAGLNGYEDYKGNGWMIVFEDPIESITGEVNSGITRITFFTLVLRVLFLAGLLWVLKRYLLDPVIALSETSRRINAGEKYLRNPENRKDELGVLAKEFNAMVDRFQELNEGLEKKVSEKTRQLQDELSEKDLRNKALEDTKKSTLNLLEDISLERAKADALVAELNRFRQTVDNSHEHVIFTDPEGVVIYANKAAERITGYSREEIIGQKPSLWGNQMSREFYRQMWNTIKAEKRLFSGEIRNKRKGGQIYIAASEIFPILDRGGEIKFFVGIERDITEEKKLEEARVNFIAIASHQLRTPITSIKWIAELLLAGDLGALNKEQADLVGDLSVSARRMIQLVNSLLNIARIESEDLSVSSEPVDLRKIYDSILKEFEVSVKSKKLKFTFINNAGTAEFRSDYNLFYEILKNLLSNSIKYTAEGGLVETSVSAKDNSIIFSVKDTGIGIPKNQQDQVFKKLFRADNAVKMNTDGTGLGMYIIKNLVDLLSGKVWFESEENKGTTVYVSLPLSGPKEHKGTKSIISAQ